MASAHKLRFFDTAGNLKYELSGKKKANFLDLSYTININSPGLISLELPGDADVLYDLDDKWQVEVWRKPEGHDWHQEIVGLYRKLDWSYSNQSYVKLTLPGLMEMLRWRIVDFPANTAGKSAFAGEKAETIANALVKYNATSAATTANGRGRNGAAGYPFTGLSVEADGGGGNTLDWYCGLANLLTTLQDIAEIGGGDFDIVKTSPTAWQWRWFEGQLGTDRRDTIVFSMDRGNMANPNYIEDRTSAATVAIVGGKDTDEDRDIERVTSTEYSVDNDIEVFVSGVSVKGDDAGEITAALEDKGHQELETKRTKKSFDFDVVQVEGTEYGVDYFAGDLVTAINPVTGDEIDMKVISATIGLNKSSGKESIGIEIEEYSG